MTILEAIRSRRSVRSFETVPLKEEDKEKLLEYAGRLENPYGLPITWKILDAEEYGLSSPVITGTDLYMAGKMRRIPHAEEAFGYTFEKVVLFAQSLGIGTTWIAGTMNRSAFEKAMDLNEEEVMPCVSPLGYPAKKMSFKEAMMRKGVKADSRLAFEELFFNTSMDKPLKADEAGKLTEVLEAVRLAPSAVNKQPWRIVICQDKAHFYEKSSRGYTSGNDWDIQKIDMGIALCHFEVAAEECGFDVSFEFDDPMLPVEKDLHYMATYRFRDRS